MFTEIHHIFYFEQDWWWSVPSSDSILLNYRCKPLTLLRDSNALFVHRAQPKWFDISNFEHFLDIFTSLTVNVLFYWFEWDHQHIWKWKLNACKGICHSCTKLDVKPNMHLLARLPFKAWIVTTLVYEDQRGR